MTVGLQKYLNINSVRIHFDGKPGLSSTSFLHFRWAASSTSWLQNQQLSFAIDDLNIHLEVTISRKTQDRNKQKID